MHRPSCRAEANLPTVIINGVHATKPKGAVHYNIYCFLFLLWCNRFQMHVHCVGCCNILNKYLLTHFCHCTLFSPFFLFLYSEI